MNPVFLRVFAIAAALAVALLLLRRWLGGDRGAPGDTFRPRAKWPGTRRGADAPRPAERFVLARASLAGLRDPYTGAQVDPDRPLLRCAGCQSVYHADSVDELARLNARRCVTCNGTQFNGVEVVE